jgi:hypothetical protein
MQEAAALCCVRAARLHLARFLVQMAWLTLPITSHFAHPVKPVYVHALVEATAKEAWGDEDERQPSAI